MAMFNVKVCRIGYGFRTIEVEAESLEQAEVKAIDLAGNYEFSGDGESEYVIDGEPTEGEKILIQKLAEVTAVLEERNRQHAGFSEVIKKSFTDGPQTREFLDGGVTRRVTITGVSMEG